MVRNGSEYLAGLNDERQVWLGKTQVKVTEEPVFQGSLKGMAGYFDWQNRFADDCVVANDATGEIANASLIVPRNAEDLEARHKAFDRLARYSYGMLGRTPDYVNVTLAGFVARDDGFVVDGDRRWADNLRAFHKEVAANDLSLTHTIINPTIDKGAGDFEGVNAGLALRVVRRTPTSIIVRGAKVLATLGPFADELFVYPAHPIPPNTPKEYAISFSVPVGTKGVHTICRDHTGVDASVKDNPFSSRFDEQDAFIIFDDVEVPLDRVFIDGDIKAYNDTPRNGWFSNVLQQTSIRAAVKLEFAFDLCRRIAQITNTEKRPDVAAMLGEIKTYANLTRAAIRAAEADAYDHGNGAFFLNQAPVRAIKNLMPTWMIRVNDIITSMGSHNLLCTPSAELFDNDQLGTLLDTYLVGANDTCPRERSRIMRMAWDFAGSALGKRVELYERFYLSSQPRNFQLEHTFARVERQEDMVSDLLEDLANY